MSTWGHDFRPEYKELGKLRAQLGKQVPVMALTATATTECQQDIKKLLKLAKDCRCIQSSFNRPNLHYSVRRMRMDQKADELIDYLKDWPKGTSGLVYCLSRKETEATCEQLCQAGIPAGCYHAGLSASRRRDVQQAWQNGEPAVVCAYPYP